jgi:hypothetical protein
MLWFVVRLTLLSCILSSALRAAQPRDFERPPIWRLPSPPGLREMILSAGYIFQGKVLSIQQVASGVPEGTAIMSVTFRVVQGLRGVRTGEIFTIREWAGLWRAGERYRVGENVVLFLHRPSRLGLTSPVAGPFGRFAVDAQGQMMMDEARGTILFPGPVMRPPVRLSPKRFFTLVGRDVRE